MTQISSRDIFSEVNIQLYATTTGIPAYSIGLILGYLVTNNIKLDCNTRIRPKTLVILAILLNCLIIVSSLLIDFPGVPIFIKYMINPLMRTSLVSLLCIFFYANWNGNLPEIFNFLSLRAFIILGKFSYSTFMVHFLVVWYYIGTLRYQMDVTVFPMSLDSIALYCISHILGYFMYITVEAPAMNLVKMAFTKGKQYN